MGIRQDLVVQHIVFFIVGIAGFFFVKFLGRNFFQQNAKAFYWIFLGLLLFTYFFGIEVKGSRRWIDLFVFQFQPSEVFKVFFIIYLADFYAKIRILPSNRSLFIKSFLFFIVPALLIFRQPDLGTALVFAAIYFVLTIISKIPNKYLFAVITVALVVLPIMWMTGMLHDYQKNRLLSFIDPAADKHASYNMTQAIITSGSGQLFGRGLGLGKQSQLFFLPEFHTDFAYSSLVEQFGFLGGGMVILLYSIAAFFLLLKANRLSQAKDESDKFKYYYTVGFLTMLLFQVFVNIGMNTGVMPIAGITLPLISYGGSSIVTFLIGLALLP